MNILEQAETIVRGKACGCISCKGKSAQLAQLSDETIVRAYVDLLDVLCNNDITEEMLMPKNQSNEYLDMMDKELDEQLRHFNAVAEQNVKDAYGWNDDGYGNLSQHDYD